ncbi:MAG: formimidoylglutamase, partial [Candidatus Kapaibacteriota bacterium]
YVSGMHFLENCSMNPQIVSYDGWSNFLEPREKLDKRMASMMRTTSSVFDVNEGDLVLLGIPQHIGVERNGGRIGSAQAPFTIRECLAKLSVHGLGQKEATIHDFGNILCEGRTLEDIRADHNSLVLELLKRGAFVAVIGGGHDIAFPSFKAMRDAFSDIAVINVDPHLDVRELIDGLGHSGSPFREMFDYQKPENFIEFGIQQFTAASHHREYVEQSGGRIIPYEHIRASGNASMQLSDLIRSFRDADQEIYVSFDMDAVNSAFAPGVSASAPIGFSADEIVQMAYSAGANGVRMIDIVEVNPLYDIDHRTSRLAALMMASCFAGWNSQL